MADPFDGLSRENILDGLFDRHARVASTVFFALESQTARLVYQSKQVFELFPAQELAQERELAFLDAMAEGRDSPLRPTIQELEHFAPDWAALVPENAATRATLAHLFGQKYKFAHADIPRMRQALGLDTEAVRRVYLRQYQQPLETIFISRTTLAEHLRWTWGAAASRLESMPPFWTVFSLTLTETVGAGILALPIALAGVGPLVGVVMLVVFGLVNVLTIAYMAESVARNGAIRYGEAYFGQLVNDTLGRTGSLVFSSGLAIVCFLCLWAYYVGFSTTLEDTTHIAAPVWVLLLFLANLYYLQRGSLDATIATALVIGAANICLILALSLLAFSQLRLVNLFYLKLPFQSGSTFDPSILHLLFGVILSAYFGHDAVGNCAKVVLRRDPSARALIWGAMTAQFVVIFLYCLWVVAVNGAVPAQILAGQSGTVLTPLAAEFGPIVYIFGLVFVVLGMGIGSIHNSLGLYNLVRERLPHKRWPVIQLPRRQGQLILGSSRRKAARVKSDLKVGIIYLGLEQPRGKTLNWEPRFCLDIQTEGRLNRLEITFTKYWDAAGSFERLNILPGKKVQLELEILEAAPEFVRLQVSSSLHLSIQRDQAGAASSTAGLFAQPDLEQQIVTWMLRESVQGREEVTFAEAAAMAGVEREEARAVLARLVEQGFIREADVDGEIRYRTALAGRRGGRLADSIWQTLGEPKEPAPGAGSKPGLLQRIKDGLFSRRGRFFLAVSPVGVVFLWVEWLLFTGTESFAEPLSFLGVIVVSLLGGIFPVLLLAASRRKGDIVPGVVYRFLGHPALLVSIYLVYMASLFLHGWVIWENPVQRAAAVGTGVMMLSVTIVLARQGVFKPRLVVELRKEAGEASPAVFRITSGGQAVDAGVVLAYREGEEHSRSCSGEIPLFSALRCATFHLPRSNARELKIWAYQVTPEGKAEGLAAVLKVHLDDEEKEFNLKLSAGQVVLLLNGRACRVEMTLLEDGG